MRHQIITWGMVLALLAAMPASASASSDPSLPRVSPRTLATLRVLPIQHNGRHKPFDSFARETLNHITGSPTLNGQDPILTVLSMLAHPEDWQSRPVIAIPFRPLRDALGVSPKTAHVSHEELVTTRRLMTMLPDIVEKQQRDEKLTMLEQEAMDGFDRFVAFSNLVEHRLELVPSPSTGDSNWRSIQQPEGYPAATQAAITTAWSAWIMALRDDQPDAIDKTSGQLTQTLARLNPSAYPPAWRLRLEVLYNRAAPFRITRNLYALAAVLLVISLASGARWAAAGGIAAFGVGAALHAVGIVMRVTIGGRPPVSNFYETMLWLPFVAVVLSLIFERIYRARYFGLSAALLAAIALTLADYVPLDSSITPVVAVLRSNLWLTIHVLTIVASYGALALATVLAHVYGWMVLRPQRARKTLVSLDLFLYRAIQVGVVLLAGGIMLGAVWANASWGRYWGWDPKETWALITLLWFLAILHGRFAGWLKGAGVALSTIGGFLLLLMTYYGVSFYLVGLHSYAGGHAKPLPPLLLAYLAAELVFMLVVGRSLRSRARPS